jgi:hypothetical protein
VGSGRMVLWCRPGTRSEGERRIGERTKPKHRWQQCRDIFESKYSCLRAKVEQGESIGKVEDEERIKEQKTHEVEVVACGQSESFIAQAEILQRDDFSRL